MSKTISDAERNRWFSTGYLAHGVESVDAEKHSLNGAQIIRMGEAKGHRMWIDGVMCKQVADASAALAEKGLKARFGHPDMCSDALGTFLGRWKGVTMGSDGVVRGTLHLSSTAAESPKGDLRNYIEQMAVKEPEHFGTSIVFSRDWDAEEEFAAAHVEEVDETDRTGKPTGNKLRVFKSPDPANTANLRHARLSALHAADLVDDPAATDGMFSGIGGTELAARVSEWLDTHPEILKAFSEEPGMVAIVERYATELRPFVERYTANHPTKAAESAKGAELAAESAGQELAQANDRVAALTVERDALAVEMMGVKAGLATAEANYASADKERTELAGKLTAATAELSALKAERDEACRKLAAIEAGAPPVSNVPAEGNENKGSLMERARKAKKS